MGKSLIIKGADFSVNGIPTITEELIYDGITGKTSTAGMSGSTIALSQPASETLVKGRTITKVQVSRNGTVSQGVGIYKYDTSTGTKTLLATIPFSTWASKSTHEIQIGQVSFGSNDLLMVGNDNPSSNVNGTGIAVAAGNESAGYGVHQLLSGGLATPVYSIGLMIKIWAISPQ